jgi:hypothetical protein
MDHRPYRLVLGLLLALSLSGCDLVGDILEAGFWIGAIVVILILVLIVWVISKIFD